MSRAVICILLAFHAAFVRASVCNTALSLPDPPAVSQFDFPVNPYEVNGFGFAQLLTNRGVQVRHLGEDVPLVPATPIYAIGDGNIIYSCTDVQYFGQVVVIEHKILNGSIVASVYGHLSKRPELPLRSTGPVHHGDVIGYVGYDDENGDGGPHLHLGIRKGRHPKQWVYFGRSGRGEDVDFDTNCTSIGGRFTSPTAFIDGTAGPLLRISSPNICPAGPSCSGAQGATFVFDGKRFSSCSTAQRNISGPSGAAVTPITAGLDGIITWSFSSSCSTQVGTYSIFATDVLTTNASNTVTEIVSGNCPATTVSPTSFDFGTVTVGSSSQTSFTITSIGTANLVINEIAVSPSDFTFQVPSTLILAPGASTTLPVTFRPRVTGPQQGTLTIISNASTSPTSVTLTGTGANPPPPPPANQGGGPAGGNIRALAMDPSNPSTIYAGANVLFDALAQTFEQKRSGGIFKTIDGGQSWIAVSNGLPDTPVQSLALDPNNPNTVYAAIEANGVFKTVDGGQNWNPVNTGLTDLFIFVLAVDPRNSSTVYAGSDSGAFFKSTNGGQSWTSVNLGLTASVTSLAFDPTNPSVMYVGSSPNGATAGLFKTTDGGQSWTLISAGLNEPPLGRAVTVSAIAIDPTDSGILYVAGVSLNSSGDVFKSADGGQSWTLMALRLGVSSILVDPSQPAALFAAGSSGFFTSADAGASWVAMNAGLTDTEVQAFIMSPAIPSTLYVATVNDGVFKTVDGGQLWASAAAGITARIVGALAVDPSNSATLYAGSGASLFKTTDSGATWIPLDAIDPGQKVGVLFGFLSFAIDPTDSNTLYVGGFIPSGVLKSTNGGQSWVAATEPFLGNVSGLAIEPTAPSTVYAGSISNGILKSTDSGQSWIVTPLIFSSPGNAVTAVVVDPNDAATVYAGAAGGAIFKSTDGALSWTPVLTDSFFSLVAVPTLPRTTLYAGTFTGSVYKSADGGATWSVLLSGVSDSQGHLVSVRALAVPASTPTTVYAGTLGAGVYKSTDGGQTWSAVNVGLPNLRILRLAIDQANPSTVYAATHGAGVFKSTDGGQTWQPTGAN